MRYPLNHARSALQRFFGVPLRAQTYRNLAYLLLAFPLGVLYFTGVTAGLSTGTGLALTLVGVPVLVATVAAAALVAGFEARLATWLVGVEVSPPAAVRDLDGRVGSVDDLLDATGRLLTEPTTWTGLLLVLLKFVFGVVAFGALLAAGVLVTVLLAAPLYYDVAGVSYTLGPYPVTTLGEALAVAGLGVLAALVSLHLFNGLARLGGIATAVLLGDEVDGLSTPT